MIVVTQPAAKNFLKNKTYKVSFTETFLFSPNEKHIIDLLAY